jgi:hypothetical protein
VNNLLEKETRLSSSSKSPVPSNVHRLLCLLIYATLATTLVTGILLLICDVFPMILPHALLSAVPLLLIGAASLAFQALIRPKKALDLFKALIVSAAFLLWGIDQLLPAGWFATTLGDLVIVLYVIDLGWMMAGILRASYHERRKQESDERKTPHVPDMQTEPILTRN